jgi:hypothetical protein
LHEQLFKELSIVHIQVDELYTRVRRWAKRVWEWTAQDAQSKAWLAWQVGRRTQADAHRLVHCVKRVVAQGCVPVFTSDGPRQYFYALTAHFGQWVNQEDKRTPVWQALPALLYGQFRKIKAGRKLTRVYTKMLRWRTVGATRGLAVDWLERSHPDHSCGVLESHSPPYRGRLAPPDLGLGAQCAYLTLAWGLGCCVFHR